MIKYFPSSKMFLHDITMKLGKNCYDENIVKLFDTTALETGSTTRIPRIESRHGRFNQSKNFAYLASSYYRNELERAEQILRDSAAKYVDRN